MNWNKLENLTNLEAIKAQSAEQPVLIFKHSISCPTSAAALRRLESKWNSEKVPTLQPYYLDLLNYRTVSNEVAKLFEVRHESPQILLIRNGKCVYHTSHLNISWEKIEKIYQTEAK